MQFAFSLLFVKTLFFFILISYHKSLNIALFIPFGEYNKYIFVFWKKPNFQISGALWMKIWPRGYKKFNAHLTQA